MDKLNNKITPDGTDTRLNPCTTLSASRTDSGGDDNCLTKNNYSDVRINKLVINDDSGEKIGRIVKELIDEEAPTPDVYLKTMAPTTQSSLTSYYKKFEDMVFSDSDDEDQSEANLTAHAEKIVSDLESKFNSIARYQTGVDTSKNTEHTDGNSARFPILSAIYNITIRQILLINNSLIQQFDSINNEIHFVILEKIGEIRIGKKQRNRKVPICTSRQCYSKNIGTSEVLNSMVHRFLLENGIHICSLDIDRCAFVLTSFGIAINNYVGCSNQQFLCDAMFGENNSEKNTLLLGLANKIVSVPISSRYSFFDIKSFFAIDFHPLVDSVNNLINSEIYSRFDLDGILKFPPSLVVFVFTMLFDAFYNKGANTVPSVTSYVTHKFSNFISFVEQFFVSFDDIVSFFLSHSFLSVLADHIDFVQQAKRSSPGVNSHALFSLHSFISSPLRVEQCNCMFEASATVALFDAIFSNFFKLPPQKLSRPSSLNSLSSTESCTEADENTIPIDIDANADLSPIIKIISGDIRVCEGAHTSAIHPEPQIQKPVSIGREYRTYPQQLSDILDFIQVPITDDVGEEYMSGLTRGIKSLSRTEEQKVYEQPTRPKNLNTGSQNPEGYIKNKLFSCILNRITKFLVTPLPILRGQVTKYLNSRSATAFETISICSIMCMVSNQDLIDTFLKKQLEIKCTLSEQPQHDETCHCFNRTPGKTKNHLRHLRLLTSACLTRAELSSSHTSAVGGHFDVNDVTAYYKYHEGSSLMCRILPIATRIINLKSFRSHLQRSLKATHIFGNNVDLINKYYPDHSSIVKTPKDSGETFAIVKPSRGLILSDNYFIKCLWQTKISDKSKCLCCRLNRMVATVFSCCSGMVTPCSYHSISLCISKFPSPTQVMLSDEFLCQRISDGYGVLSPHCQVMHNITFEQCDSFRLTNHHYVDFFSDMLMFDAIEDNVIIGHPISGVKTKIIARNLPSFSFDGKYFIVSPNSPFFTTELKLNCGTPVYKDSVSDNRPRNPISFVTSRHGNCYPLNNYSVQSFRFYALSAKIERKILPIVYAGQQFSSKAELVSFISTACDDGDYGLTLYATNDGIQISYYKGTLELHNSHHKCDSSMISINACDMFNHIFSRARNYQNLVADFTDYYC